MLADVGPAAFDKVVDDGENPCFGLLVAAVAGGGEIARRVEGVILLVFFARMKLPS